MAEDEGVALTLDCLTFDCIVCVCEFLSPEDLARFSAVYKVPPAHVREPIKFDVITIIDSRVDFYSTIYVTIHP